MDGINLALPSIQWKLIFKILERFYYGKIIIIKNVLSQKPGRAGLKVYFCHLLTGLPWILCLISLNISSLKCKIRFLIVTSWS
jgi:hypothetical protein